MCQMLDSYGYLINQQTFHQQTRQTEEAVLDVED